MIGSFRIEHCAPGHVGAPSAEAERPWVSESLAMESVTFSPPANIFIGDDEMAVMVDLPGVDQKTLEVNIEGRRLTIGGRRVLGPWAKARRRHIEWPYGTFSRTFWLPEDVDPRDIHAEFREGILLVRLPRRGMSRGRRVPIRVMPGHHV